MQHALTSAYAKFGEPGQAVSELDALLRAPSPGVWVSVPLLKLDPQWDPIRHDPRFQALLKKYSIHEPTSATSAAPVSATTRGAGHG
ncbi:MAG: hypothetical protein ACREPZ_11965 [Rhodanobacteraceae bacterium]